jgi:hypothetical protein
MEGDRRSVGSLEYKVELCIFREVTWKLFLRAVLVATVKKVKARRNQKQQTCEKITLRSRLIGRVWDLACKQQLQSTEA